MHEQAEQTKALEEELTEQRKKVKEANAKELEFLKKQRRTRGDRHRYRAQRKA